MTRAHTFSEPAAEIHFHASGFLVKVGGSGTPAALAQFHHFLKLRRLVPSEFQLEDTLRRAQKDYFVGAIDLSVYCGTVLQNDSL
jgi:hypothetical protein